ncbi:hypothetical protein AKJ66_01535 [candidate division MSBL1 archaeon SCGC-AAA259E22]|uniref:Uncharacterized protein n=1 Tax=candidate division MSBL1 archaeon SCGC-AAA259E22 TaxID=1698265 RepID=A0A133UHU3_9EURY|nr:hypothetical protein AKJ66_01535 [candidate division MSBL1 archaeon SCGC-AAA259E22]
MQTAKSKKKPWVRKRDVAVIMLLGKAVPKKGYKYKPITNREICRAYGYDGFRPPHSLQMRVCHRLREMRKCEPPKVKVVNNSPGGKYKYRLTPSGESYARYIYENNMYNKELF